MAMSQELLAGYLDTDYSVVCTGDTPLVLRIGDRSAPLADRLQALGLRTAAFITAYNPFSTPTSLVKNLAAQALLEGKLRNLSEHVRPGVGRSRTGNWPAEPSFLILGITYDVACTLGREFGQNAIVFAGDNAVPLLAILATSASGNSAGTGRAD